MTMIDADAIYYDAVTKRTVILGSSGGHGFFCGTPREYLNSLCIPFGSTYQGRIDAYRALTGTVQKPAVMLSEITGQIFFPTVSPESRDCVWICLQTLFKIRKAENNTSVVIFSDGNTIELAVSVRTLRTQMQRCDLFLQKMSEYIGKLPMRRE